jgi:YesN/AraC family two-component response regulator
MATDFENSINYINSLFELNVKEGTSVELAKFFIYDLTTIILKICDSTTLSLDIKKKIFTKLSNFDTITEIRNNIEFAVKELCEYFYLKTSDNKLSDLVIEIIRDNYQKNDFSVSFIGYKLDKAPSYISMLFKQETGEILSNYINKYRINIAKELLTDTELSIKKIATSVGYTNSNVFISSFKKIEGITPGQYKVGH